MSTSDAVETTFDRELTARKVTLSRETRGLCLAVIKAVLAELDSMPTPFDGLPTIKGRALTPEESAQIDAAFMAQKNKWPCRLRDKSEWCDRNGPDDFMGHTCMTPKPDSFEGYTSYRPDRDL